MALPGVAEAGLDTVTRLAAEHGFIPAGETSFVGVGQRGEPGYILVSFVRT